MERPERSYRYRLTEKGTKAALLFVLFHQRLFGPLAYSLFTDQPHHQPHTKLDGAYRKADAAISNLVQLLQAA